MVRALIGGLLGGLALFFTGFIFWGTPLARLAISTVDDAKSAALQAALAQNLTENGTGTYAVPWPGSGAGTVLYGKGPIATIHFVTQGFPALDTGSLIGGLLMALLAGVLIAAALYALAERLPSFADRLRVVLLVALATTGYSILGQPVFNHFGWGYFIYAFVADFLGYALAALIIVRWFLPARGVASVEQV